MSASNLVHALVLSCLLTAPVLAQSPVDVSSPDPIPGVIALPAPDGSVDIAWRSTDGRILLSNYSGPGFGQARHLRVKTSLPLLAGFARDEAGNRYVAVMRREQATPQEWAAGYRPGVANILKIPAGDNRTQLLADVNRHEFSQKTPIFNPLSMAGNAYVNAEMVYANGTLVLALGHNNGKADDIHETGNLIGIGLDGGVRYGGGGEQHPGQVKLNPDGSGFVMSQIFDQGIGLSTLKPDERGTLRWSNFVLVYEIPRENQAEEALTIAGVVPTSDKYLLVFSSGKDWLWNHGPREIGTQGACAIRVMDVSRNFDQLPKFDWWNNVRHAQGNFPLRTIAAPQPGQSFIRPVVQQLPSGQSIVVYEQWDDPRDGFSPASLAGVRATLLDAAGNVQANSQLFPGVRIQKSATPFVLSTPPRIAWVNGVTQPRQLVLQTIDTGLQLSTVVLGQGGNSPSPQPGNAANVSGDWELAGVVGFKLEQTRQEIRLTNSQGNVSIYRPVANQPNTYAIVGGLNYKLQFSSGSKGTWTVNGEPFPIARKAGN